MCTVRELQRFYNKWDSLIAPRFKCYKNASRLNRYNFPTDNAIDFLISTLHSEMVYVENRKSIALSVGKL